MENLSLLMLAQMISKEPKTPRVLCSPKATNVESTPVLRAPVDDTQELFGDDQSGEQTTSSQEEEMGPSLLTMQLKFDSVPHDVSDEEDNDEENANLHGQRQVKDSSFPRGDPVKVFVDEEAEEEQQMIVTMTECCLVMKKKTKMMMTLKSSVI